MEPPLFDIVLEAKNNDEVTLKETVQVEILWKRCQEIFIRL